MKNKKYAKCMESTFWGRRKNVQNELFGEIFQIVRFLKIEDLLRKSSINGKNS